MRPQEKIAGQFLAIMVLALMWTPVVSATSREFVLHAFGSGKDASQSNSAMISDASGNLYGEAGGGAHGFGAIFKLTHAATGGWKESVIYSFAGGKQGSGPSGGLVWDENGNLYGTTIGGGNARLCHASGCGTVFELSPSAGGQWKETVLYRFGSCRTSGCRPHGGVIFDQSGNLFGTTLSGGTGNCNGFNPGCGTVFMLSPGSGGWTESVIHSFAGKFADGSGSQSGLLIDKTGNLYGATLGHFGVIFELSPTSGGGWQEEVLYAFLGGNDGEVPNGPLVFDMAGNLYGTTQGGGSEGGGVAFELTPGSSGAWTETVIHDFTVKTGDEPVLPLAGLAFDPAGNLYGTTYYGGGTSFCNGRGCGTVFELTPGSGGQWTENVLHSFTAGSDGQNPMAAVTVVKGKLYGTTMFGGIHNLGIVFQVNP
jgi:uncharacterized repeat protein (TIGR03803 family)